jgi:hypothetical protein
VCGHSFRSVGDVFCCISSLISVDVLKEEEEVEEVEEVEEEEED